MTVGEQIGDAAGARPPEAVELYLEDLLLPGEPVLAAVSGTVGRMPGWAVVTPGIAVVVRASARVTVEGAATPSEGIDWSSASVRGDHQLHGRLAGDRVTLTRVPARRLQHFLAAAESVTASLDGGFPPRVAGVLRDVEPEDGAAWDGGRHARSGPAPRVPRSDLFLALAGALTDPREVGFHLALVLVATAGARGGGLPRAGRREIVISAVLSDHRTDVEDYAAVRSLRAARSGPGDAAVWREVVVALAAAVSGAAALLEPDSARARATMHVTAAALLEIADDRPAPPGPVPGDRPEPALRGGLLDTLERLQTLRESGAISSLEYDELKHAVLRE